MWPETSEEVPSSSFDGSSSAASASASAVRGRNSEANDGGSNELMSVASILKGDPCGSAFQSISPWACWRGGGGATWPSSSCLERRCTREKLRYSSSLMRYRTGRDNPRASSKCVTMKMGAQPGDAYVGIVNMSSPSKVRTVYTRQSETSIQWATCTSRAATQASNNLAATRTAEKVPTSIAHTT